MSREIKFRAWDSQNKEWLLGYEYENLGGFSMFGEIMLMDEWNAAVHAHHNGDVYINLMQYTGLKDKNGIDIYEHDIVKILYTDWPSQLDSHPELSHEEYLDSLTHKEIVVWHQYGFWLVKKIGGYPQSIHPGQHGYIEVIGNIYQNPELLEAEL